MSANPCSKNRRVYRKKIRLMNMCNNSFYLFWKIVAWIYKQNFQQTWAEPQTSVKTLLYFVHLYLHVISLFDIVQQYIYVSFLFSLEQIKINNSKNKLIKKSGTYHTKTWRFSSIEILFLLTTRNHLTCVANLIGVTGF